MKQYAIRRFYSYFEVSSEEIESGAFDEKLEELDVVGSETLEAQTGLYLGIWEFMKGIVFLFLMLIIQVANADVASVKELLKQYDKGVIAKFLSVKHGGQVTISTGGRAIAPDPIYINAKTLDIDFKRARINPKDFHALYSKSNNKIRKRKVHIQRVTGCHLSFEAYMLEEYGALGSLQPVNTATSQYQSYCTSRNVNASNSNGVIDKDAIYHKKYNDILSLLDAGKFDEAKSYARNNDSITVYGHVASFYNKRSQQAQAQRQKKDPCNPTFIDYMLDNYGPLAEHISLDLSLSYYLKFKNDCNARRNRLSKSAVVVKDDICGFGNIVLENRYGDYIAAEHYSGSYFNDGDTVYGDFSSGSYKNLVNENRQKGTFDILGQGSDVDSATQLLCN